MAHHTPLHDTHIKLGAKMVDFAGWDMPVQYPEGILKEHDANRKGVSRSLIVPIWGSSSLRGITQRKTSSVL